MHQIDVIIENIQKLQNKGGDNYRSYITVVGNEMILVRTVLNPFLFKSAVFYVTATFIHRIYRNNLISIFVVRPKPRFVV